MKSRSLPLLLWVFLLAASFWQPAWAKDPKALYLTWLHDPTTTMTIQWHTSNKVPDSEVSYRKAGESEWHTQTGTSHPLSQTSLLVHTVELTNLEPYTTYLFRTDNTQIPYRFRTLPQNSATPIQFVVGGDAYLFFSLFKKMNQQIAQNDPDFVVLGGDIAYTDGKTPILKSKNWELKRWQVFLKEWTKQMRTSDRRLIPLLALLGNHDITFNRKTPDLTNARFYQLFAMPTPEQAYRVLDIGKNLSLILLDSGHHTPIFGPQTDWLADTLAKRLDIPLKFAIYHVAAYPSRYAYSGIKPTQIRKNWVPLFEQYGVQAAFEHHNHTFKRTHPIKAGKVDPAGILYLGDGSWGVSPRQVTRASNTWYLAKSQKTNCFWLATLQNQQCSIKAFNLKGQLLDDLSLPLNH